MKRYDVSMEISGEYAIWTRPDTGDCPVSYPAPTFSAVRGIFESILWGPAIEVIPTAVEICSPIKYQNYQTNYGGPLRKSDQLSGNNSYQLLATVLIKVCYRLYAEVRPTRKRFESHLSPKAIEWDNATTSPGHAYKAIFERRLKRGQCYSIPFLGWKEFVPDYVGVFRDDVNVCSEINLSIPSMTKSIFLNQYSSDISFSYFQDVKIENGLLIYPQEEVI